MIYFITFYFIWLVLIQLSAGFSAYNSLLHHSSNCHDIHSTVRNWNINLYHKTSTSLSSQNHNEENIRIRLNKVFKATHSRREADKLISSGRISVNGEKVTSKGGHYVIPHVDVVTLDGVTIKGWEDMNAVDLITEDSASHISTQYNSENQSKSSKSEMKLTKSHFQYIKYYKPTGVTCTTDLNDRDNIIDSIQRHGYRSPHRIYPVGRLDKDTSGLILLTSDGRLPNAVLRGMNKQPKVYKVALDFPISDEDIQRLRDGIIITTVAQRDNTVKKLTERTKPCKVERLGVKAVQMTLMEGRNRQIRKMMGALGYTVLKLHRTQFMNINLESRSIRKQKDNESRSSRNKTSLSAELMRPGDWAFLNEAEMELVEEALRLALIESNQEH